MGLAHVIAEKLENAFSPESLEVIDNSSKHIGHAGYREGGETHWKIIIRSKAFNGKSRLEMQRMVNHVLEDELNGPIHALELDVGGDKSTLDFKHTFAKKD